MAILSQLFSCFFLSNAKTIFLQSFPSPGAFAVPFFSLSHHQLPLPYPFSVFPITSCLCRTLIQSFPSPADFAVPLFSLSHHQLTLPYPYSVFPITSCICHTLKNIKTLLLQNITRRNGLMAGY